jgi:3-isopropylmalate/(R)-2-methylmalate dehydratase small subunit
MEPFTRLEAVAAPLARTNVDTDQIVPALYLQKPRSNNFGDYLFHDVRRDAHGARRPDFVLNDPVYAKAQILVAGRNFGCGSSREHAVWALMDGGFRVVIAPSFGDIFQANALKNGLLPACLPQDVVQALLDELHDEPGVRLTVDLHAQTVIRPGGPSAHFEIDGFAKQCLLKGFDELAYTLSQSDRIDEFERTREAQLATTSVTEREQT